MREQLWLRFLGLAETRQYTLEQRHEAPLFSVGVENTTLADEGSCGYLSPKLSEVLSYYSTFAAA
jgi:hypothetical protein